jgi:PKD repeat protein
LPIARFEANQTGGCAGLNVQFSDSSLNNPTSRTWVFEGGNPASSTLPNPTVSYTTAGVYPVTLQVETNLGPTELVQSSFVNVGSDFTVSATYIQPTAGNSNGRITLVLPGSALNYTYNWYDATPSAGNKLLNQPAGTYPVSVTSIEGCTVDTFFTLVNSLSINELDNIEFKISPNPTNNFIKVSWEGVAKPKALQLFDLQGRTLIAKGISNTSFEILDLSNLANGVYSLQLTSEFGNRSFLVVKVDGN